MKTCLAIDLGASSGRVIAGWKEGDEICLRELHRFPTRQIRLGDYLYWDFQGIFAEILEGLKTACRHGLEVASIGVDTWGVDYALVDRLGRLKANPVSYRDSNHQGRCEISPKRYSLTGIQQLDINTLPRLLANPDEGTLLFIPDLINHFLCGSCCTELSIASTSEMLNAMTSQWMDFKGLKSIRLPEIVPAGTVIGTLLPHVAAETGLSESVKVITVGAHDTASAAYASNADFDINGAAFLSCGTWSLLGAAIDGPITSEEARKAGFSNEKGVGGKTLFLQNITGLWVLQELIKEWQARGIPTDYPTLLQQADEAAIDVIIDIDDPLLATPGDMESKVITLAKSQCKLPRNHDFSVGEIVSIVLRSLAARYKQGIDGLNRLLPREISKLVIVGGGVKNKLLVDFTRSALGIPVVEGPAEATAIGNIMCQLKVLG